MELGLSGRTALVTGGSKGLGLAMAEGLASAGADVVLVSRHEDQAKAAAEQVAKDYGHRAIGVAADVSSQADTERMAAREMADTEEARKEPIDQAPEGGRYIVNDVEVDANGEPLKKGT